MASLDLFCENDELWEAERTKWTKHIDTILLQDGDTPNDKEQKLATQKRVSHRISLLNTILVDKCTRVENEHQPNCWRPSYLPFHTNEGIDAENEDENLYDNNKKDWHAERQLWADQIHFGEVVETNNDEIKALKATLRAQLNTKISQVDHIISVRDGIAHCRAMMAK